MLVFSARLISILRLTWPDKSVCPFMFDICTVGVARYMYVIQNCESHFSTSTGLLMKLRKQVKDSPRHITHQKKRYIKGNRFMLEMFDHLCLHETCRFSQTKHGMNWWTTCFILAWKGCTDVSLISSSSKFISNTLTCHTHSYLQYCQHIQNIWCDLIVFIMVAILIIYAVVI